MAPRNQPAPIPVRITELRMSAPPKQSLPVPVNIQTAIMRVPNIPTAFYRFLYTQVGRRWQWVERLRMDDEVLAEILNDRRTNVTVLYVDGGPAGFFELFQRNSERTELVHFGLFEHALGLGLGKWFLLQTLYAAWSTDPTSLSVTTNNLDHPRALQLYQMFGFSPVSTREATILPLSDAELLELARRG